MGHIKIKTANIQPNTSSTFTFNQYSWGFFTTYTSDAELMDAILVRAGSGGIALRRLGNASKLTVTSNGLNLIITNSTASTGAYAEVIMFNGDYN